MHLLCLLGQDCLCPLIAHAASVHFPSVAASHFGVSLTAGAETCLSLFDRCFKYDSVYGTWLILICGSGANGPQRRKNTRNRS